MKKLKYSLILLLLLVLSGCNQENAKEITSKVKVDEETTTEDIFKLPAAVSKEEYSYGAEIISTSLEKSGDGKYQYAGGEVELKIRLNNSGQKTEVGIILFVDGMIQPHRISGQEELKTMSPVTVGQDETEEINVHFTPVAGEKGKTVTFNFCSLLEPSFQVENKQSSYGNRHKILQFGSNEIVMKAPGEKSRRNQKVNKTSRTLTKDEMIEKQYIKTADDGTERKNFQNSINLNVSKDGRIPTFLNIDQNGVTCQVNMFSDLSGRYNMMVFVNHQLMEFQNGITYCELNLEKDQYVEIPVSIAKKDLENIQNHTMYILLVPLEGSGNDVYQPDSIFLSQES